jgi:hypothetical protein
MITINDDIKDALMRHDWVCQHCGARPAVSIRQDEQKRNTFVVFTCHGLDEVHLINVDAHHWRQLFRIKPFRPLILSHPKPLRYDPETLPPMEPEPPCIDISDEEVKRLPGH